MESGNHSEYNNNNNYNRGRRGQTRGYNENRGYGRFNNNDGERERDGYRRGFNNNRSRGYNRNYGYSSNRGYRGSSRGRGYNRNRGNDWGYGYGGNNRGYDSNSNYHDNNNNGYNNRRDNDRGSGGGYRRGSDGRNNYTQRRDYSYEKRDEYKQNKSYDYGNNYEKSYGREDEQKKEYNNNGDGGYVSYQNDTYKGYSQNNSYTGYDYNTKKNENNSYSNYNKNRDYKKRDNRSYTSSQWKKWNNWSGDKVPEVDFKEVNKKFDDDLNKAIGMLKKKKEDIPIKEERKDDKNMENKSEEEKEKDIFKNYTAGINFENYGKLKVEVFPTEGLKDVQFKHSKTFKGMNLPEKVIENIKRAKYKTPTPIQQHAIPIGNKKIDIMGAAETGSGKTFAFLIPIISNLIKNEDYTKAEERNPRALILSPTRELCQQIYYEAQKFVYKTKIGVCALFGGIKKYIQDPSIPGSSIIICTPGRLNDLLVRKDLTLDECKWFCLDEADRMLDMGFEPQIQDIIKFLPENEKERTNFLFSATLSKQIRQLAKQYIRKDHIFLKVGETKSTSNVQQLILRINEKDKLDKLLEIHKKVEGRGMLVFLNTKVGCENLFHKFSNMGIKCERIHGDMDQMRRDDAISLFRYKSVNVLFCTDVLSRGIDIGRIQVVINLDFPDKGDDYIHRIGRCGRVGNLGLAITFFSEYDTNNAKFMIKTMEETNQEVPEWLKTLENVRVPYKKKQYHTAHGMSLGMMQKQSKSKKNRKDMVFDNDGSIVLDENDDLLYTDDFGGEFQI